MGKEKSNLKEVVLAISIVYFIFFFINLSGEGYGRKSDSYLGFPKYFYGDSYRYFQLARAIADGRLYIYDSIDDIDDEILSFSLGVSDRVYITQSPGISIVSAPFYLLFKEPGVYAAASLVGLIACISLYCLLRFFVSDKTSKVITLFYAFGTYIFTYSQFLYNDVLTCLLVSTSFIMLLKHLRDGKTKNIVFSGIALGLIPLTKPSAIILSLVFVPYLYYRKGIKSTLILLMSLLVGMLPFIAYNIACFGAPLTSGYSSLLAVEDGKFYTVNFTNLNTWKNNPLNIFTLIIVFFITQPITLTAVAYLSKTDKGIRYFLVTSFLSLGLLYSFWWNSMGLLCWGWRFMTPILPFFAVSSAMAYEKNIIPKKIFWILFYLSSNIAIFSLHPLVWQIFYQFTPIANTYYDILAVLPHHPLN
ncbi:MAG: glycosyltransferase family 39 protein [Candidatus Altiarchaeota archaeon]|nr:glycosyltransferase family 39 protein [Candidatus Altiarchaeota archaeon]